VGDILLTAPPGYIFSPFKRGAHDRNYGYHGWPPSDDDMCGVFFAAGPGVPVRTIEEASILDIAPTALKLLGLDIPTRCEGKPLF
jgi:arylsulfatase A-like enzyme